MNGLIRKLKKIDTLAGDNIIEILKSGVFADDELGSDIHSIINEAELLCLIGKRDEGKELICSLNEILTKGVRKNFNEEINHIRSNYKLVRRLKNKNDHENQYVVTILFIIGVFMGIAGAFYSVMNGGIIFCVLAYIKLNSTLSKTHKWIVSLSGLALQLLLLFKIPPIHIPFMITGLILMVTAIYILKVAIFSEETNITNAIRLSLFTSDKLILLMDENKSLIKTMMLYNPSTKVIRRALKSTSEATSQLDKYNYIVSEDRVKKLKRSVFLGFIKEYSGGRIASYKSLDNESISEHLNNISERI